MWSFSFMIVIFKELILTMKTSLRVKNKCLYNNHSSGCQCSRAVKFPAQWRIQAQPEVTFLYVIPHSLYVHKIKGIKFLKKIKIKQNNNKAVMSHKCDPLLELHSQICAIFLWFLGFDLNPKTSEISGGYDNVI